MAFRKRRFGGRRRRHRFGRRRVRALRIGYRF